MVKSCPIAGWSVVQITIQIADKLSTIQITIQGADKLSTIQITFWITDKVSSIQITFWITDKKSIIHITICEFSILKSIQKKETSTCLLFKWLHC